MKSVDFYVEFIYRWILNKNRPRKADTGRPFCVKNTEMGGQFAQKILKWGNFFCSARQSGPWARQIKINEKMKPVDFYLEPIYHNNNNILRFTRCANLNKIIKMLRTELYTLTLSSLMGVLIKNI